MLTMTREQAEAIVKELLERPKMGFGFTAEVEAAPEDFGYTGYVVRIRLPNDAGDGVYFHGWSETKNPNGDGVRGFLMLCDEYPTL